MSGSTLFPLPCSSFEKYMLVDDRPAHPMVSFLETRYQGTVDVDFLRISGERVIERHPLMAACVAGKRLRDWHWVQAPHPLRIQLIDSAHELPGLGNEGMNLREASGLKVWVVIQGGTSTLYLQVHHAVSDALGMLTFLMEWLVLYSQQVSGFKEMTTLSPPSSSRLVYREDLRGLKSPYPRRDRWKRIGAALVGRRTALLKPSRGNEPPPGLTPQHCVTCFTAHEVEVLRTFARRHQVTLGDTLLAAVIQACQVWNGPQHNESLRIVVPVNRRVESEVFLSAANKLSYKYVSRLPGELIDPLAALKSISEEMGFVRRNRTSIVSYLKVLRILEKTGLLGRILNSGRSFGTVVFSNLGDLNQLFSSLLPVQDGKFMAGNLLLESLSCAPPRRPLTHTTVVSYTYAGNLFLCSRGDGRGLNVSDTQLFLEEIRNQVTRLVNL